ncbi:MAG: hypothetical protein COS89_04445 [Deltaproteobacteria bacterium CG07_land_8_20_14_0_80_38_7]|nr:MAG: hypothetical protein COS89_04445 [Deltaproteobacteria bacterium CG07_land_8_20_14_0_80_38_7]
MKDLQPGMLIDDKYMLLRKLSEGGGGVVWEVKPKSSPEKIALKVLKWSEFSQSKTSTAEKFKREFELFKKVSHPNIAKIYDFGFDQKNDIYYFTSELISGGDLKSLAKSSILVIENLLLQALRALEYLRNFGILHLDIKPQNLLLRSSADNLDSVKQLALIDFGLAGFQPPEKPGGTPNYMSPEIVMKRLICQGNLDFETTLPKTILPGHRSDLYSLGVSFYYILTGILPYAVNVNGKLDIQKTMLKHLTLDTPLPPSEYNPEIPSYLDAIILRLIAMNPNDRYQTALMAAQALCFRSPNQLEPESEETIQAYLPEDGILIGRYDEKKLLEDSLYAVSCGLKDMPSIVCVFGPSGTGKTRLLKYLSPNAQQLELEVVNKIEGDVKLKRPTAFLIDNVVLKNAGNVSDVCVDINSIKRLAELVLKNPDSKSFVVFSINADFADKDKVLEKLNLNSSVLQIVELGNFTRGELIEYVSHILGGVASSKIVDELYDSTYGNPRFIADIFKQLIKQGELFSYFSGKPDTNTLSTLDFSISYARPPKSLSEYLLNKVNKCSGEEIDILHLMACYARPVSNKNLGNVNERFVNGLLSSGLISQVKETSLYKLSNPLAPMIIESSLSNVERKKVHEFIYKILSKLSDAEKDSVELNYHLAFGSDGEMQSKAALNFTLEALGKYHPTEATVILENLFDFIPKENWNLKKAILVRQGKALSRVGRFEEASKLYESLKGLSDKKEDKIKLDIRADELLGVLALRRRLLKNADTYLMRAYDKFVDSFMVGVRDLKTDDDALVIQHIRLRNSIAGLRMRQGLYDEAVVIFKENQDATVKLPMELRKRITNNELAEVYVLMGQYEKAFEIADQYIKFARQINNFDMIANELRIMANAYRFMGNFDKAMENYRAGLEVARQYHLFEHQLRIQNSLANLLMQTGNWLEATDEYKPALDLSMRLEGKASSVDMMANIGFAFNKLKKYDDAIEYLELAVDFAKGPEALSSVQIKKRIPHIYVELGHACLEKGRFDKSERYLNLALSAEQYQSFDDISKYNLHATLLEIDLARKNNDSAKQRIPLLKDISKNLPHVEEHLSNLIKRIK